jgi:hypothetical protein
LVKPAVSVILDQANGVIGGQNQERPTDWLETNPATWDLMGGCCKTNTLTILMHQMRISTTQVSSVMLRSKTLEIRGKKCKN